MEAEVLRVLAGADAEFSAPEVHRLVGSASQFGVRKALVRLSETGLVHSTTHGNSTFWKGNRRHVLWPAIEAAVDARRMFLDRLRSELAKRDGLAAYLYGSFARRSAGPESDIDILIVHPDDTSHDTIVDFAFDLGEKILAWTGNEGHLYNATRTVVRESVDAADPVIVSIRQDAVTVIGPDFEQLLRQLRVEARSHA
ncbi:nucleotidyltransferase domain-containing protein [Herbiconiux sp. VKM Ac-2851]|uniref:nucleotidyltransferase family protein n=1 Tax=Herbiconiux sp. VKM Ac-2851 TaxID=2739025 RepID=UPI0015631F51|nr:nucleotidyltransferase domain-containing protein [Herbiconiux sp. VKM Ac-2851]